MASLQRSGKLDQINVKSEEELAMADASEAERKQKDLEQRKADVRRRLEEAGQSKKKKKGFLTPERKKKLRKLLMSKAADDLKRQQLQKEQARQKALTERTIPMPEVDNVEDKAKLQEIYEFLWARVCKLEEEKYDINNTVSSVEGTINSLTIEVNDLKGKYVKPSLKKVSKYDNKFKKMAENSAEKSSEKKIDFRNSLKVVKKDVMEEITNLKKKDDKPEWSKKPTLDTLEKEVVESEMVETPQADEADEEDELEAVEDEIEA